MNLLRPLLKIQVLFTELINSASKDKTEPLEFQLFRYCIRSSTYF